MAEDSGNDRSTEDLSDEPSAYKLQELRGQGKVFQSREVTGVLVLLATFVALMAIIQTVGDQYIDYLRDVLSLNGVNAATLSNGSLISNKIIAGGKLFLLLGFPVVLAGFIFSVIGSVMQSGWVFSWDPIQPDWSKIDPIQGFQKLFSMRQVFEGFRMLSKMVIICFVAFALIKPQVLSSSRHLLMEVGGLGQVFTHGGKPLFYILLLILMIFAGIDYWLQRREYMKQVRLTKQEAKQEQKEQDGDPMVKSRIRTIQRDMARKRMMQAVKKADVIITNPTHIAIAIVYEKDKMLAPKVVAKGADFLAQRIKKVAADAGIPLVENVPLARSLFKSVKIGQYVPRNLYQAVAEILAYVYRLKNRR